MEWYLALGLAIVLVATVYRFSTPVAGHIAVASLGLWIVGLTLFWLNESTFPNHETFREMGELVPAVLLMIAAVLTIVSLVLALAGLVKQKEA